MSGNNSRDFFLFQDFLPDNKLDFHDFGKIYPYEVERVLNDFLEDNYFEGNTKLLIITGKGEMVRPKVKEILENNSYVKEFRSGGYFTGQTGVYEVFLKG